jgi:hypothetical protein
VAELIYRTKNWVSLCLWTMGLNIHPQHLEHQRAVTCTWRRERYAGRGRAAFSLTGQPNAIGGPEMDT